MKKKTQIILPILLLVILSVTSIGYLMWNKPHPKAEEQQAVIVTAEELYHDFSGNEQMANAKYSNKVLQVTGTIGELSKNQDGKTVVVLSTSDPLGGIQCTFRDMVTVQNGQAITVKGFCNGNTMVVLLNDCVLQ